MTTLMHDLLHRAAERSPGHPLVLTPKSTVSYESVAIMATRVASALAAHGVRRHDRVLLTIDNSASWLAAYFGILEAGGVVVPLAHGARNDRLVPAILDCTPRAAIVDGPTLDAAADALARVGATVCFVDGPGVPRTSAPAALRLDDVMATDGAPRPRSRQIDLDLAAIVYTSGSTGRPRGVTLSHLNLRSNTVSIVEYLQLSQADRVAVVLPFYYVYGLSLLNTHVAVGGGLILDNRFAFPNAVLTTMQRHQATGFAGVPSTFALLLHKSSIRTMAFPDLRYVTQAGGPMPPALLDEWRAAMPAVKFFVMYGATEASARLAYLPPDELDRRRGSIGHAIPNVDLRLLREDGSEAEAGEVGEIVARGANISLGYWNAPDETAAAFRDGGYHTGDLARRDEEGYLYIVGRKQDMLKVGAHRVGAREIEDVLHEHDAVHEAAVVGAPDPLLGEVPVAFVSWRDAHADIDALRRHCRERLSDHKVPTQFIAIDELPKSGAGKIDKAALRARLAARADG